MIPAKLDCDYYMLMAGDRKVLEKYHGEYMADVFLGRGNECPSGADCQGLQKSDDMTCKTRRNRYDCKA